MRVSEGFLFHSTCYVRNGNFLKIRVSEIHVKRIRVNQGLGVIVQSSVHHCSAVIRDEIFFCNIFYGPDGSLKSYLCRKDYSMLILKFISIRCLKVYDIISPSLVLPPLHRNAKIHC